MPTEDTPDRMPEKPRNDHRFETPVVHEARSAGPAPEESRPGADAERQSPQKQEMAFERRWEKVQTVFVAGARRGFRTV
jgi:hypothetical protein